MTERSANTLALFGVGLAALMYSGFGFALLLFPTELLAAAEMHLNHPTALMEARAFYGGLELGLGLFLGRVLLLRNERRVRESVILLLFLLGGTLLGRMLGALLDGISGMYWYYAILIEAPVFLILLISCYRRSGA